MDYQNTLYIEREQHGDILGYLADVERLWHLVEKKSESQIGRGKTTESLGLETFCALLTASMNSQAGNIPNDLLVALIETKRWEPMRGLAYARQAPDPEQQAEALVAIIPYLSDDKVVQMALTAVEKINDNGKRASLLTRLVPYLPECSKFGTLYEAMRAAMGANWEWDTIQALAPLALYFPESTQLIQELIERTREYKELPRSRILLKLALYLPEPQRTDVLKEVLTLARKINDDPGSRADVMAELTPHLPESLKSETAKDALEIARQISDPGKRAQVLAKLAPFLPEPSKIEVKEEVLDAFEKIKARRRENSEPLNIREDIIFESERKHALLELSPYLARLGYLDEALAIARNYSLGDKERVQALIMLLPYLPEPQKGEVLNEALATARKINDGHAQAKASAEFVLQLAKLGNLKQIMEKVRLINDHETRVKLLTDLAPFLPESDKEKVLRKNLDRIVQIKWEWDRADALVTWAPCLSKHLPRETWDSARALQDKERRIKAFVALIPYMPEPLKNEALLSTVREVISIEDEKKGGEVLGELALRIASVEDPEKKLSPTDLNTQYLAKVMEAIALKLADLGHHEEALKTACLMPVRSEYAHATELALRLAKLGYLKEALTAARIGSFEMNAQAFVELLPYLPASEKENAFQEAMATVRKIRGEFEKGTTLIKLAERLAELGYPEMALTATLMIKNELKHEEGLNFDCEVICAQTLTKISSYLPQPLLQKALVVMRKTENQKARAEALIGLGLNLPEPKRTEILHEALTTTQKIAVNQAPSKERLELGLNILGQEWIDEVLQENGSNLTRVEALTKFALHLTARERTDVLREALVEARANENNWVRIKALMIVWPNLLEPDRTEVLQEVFTIVDKIADNKVRVRAFMKVASHLPKPSQKHVFKDALKAARKISDSKERITVLTELTPHLMGALKEKVLKEALMKAQKIEDSEIRTKILKDLARQLAEHGYIDEAKTAARLIQNDKERDEMFLEQARCFAKLGHPDEALMAAKEIRDNYYRAERSAELAQCFKDLGYFEEALELARDISKEEIRAKTLKELVPHLLTLQRAKIYSIWQETLHSSAKRSRRDLLTDLEALAPLIASLAGAEAVEKTLDAINDVVRWWP